MKQQNFGIARNEASLGETVDPVEARLPVIAGYEIGAEMGRGPLGKIYRATHAETGKTVVFRGFTKPEGADAEAWDKAKDQFRELLEQHRRVENHPNIQKIVDFGEDDGLFWIATEYFEGRTLYAILHDEGAQSLPWALNVFRQVAHAADWAGERGLSHTDLTPYNILLVNQPEADSRKIQVKVINFGLAHARKKYGSRYAAPEQLDGKEGDRRADVYAVGALLYETLTGVPLHDGDTPEAIAAQTRANKLPSPLLPDQPENLGKVLAVMLTGDPRMRYASVSEAIDDLDHERAPEAFSAQGIVLDAPEPLPKTDKPVRLQDYQLSDQDVAVIQNQRYAARRENEAELAQARRVRSIRRYVLAGVAAVLLLLGIHAATLPGQYRRLRVAALSGSPTLSRDGQTPSSLRVGDVITDDGTPQIATGPNDSVTLTSHNTRLLLEPNSALTVTELNYRNGGLRRFSLQRGVVLASVARRQRAGILEIDAPTPAGMGRTQIKSGVYALSAAPDSLTIAAATGNPVIALNDERQTLTAGNVVTLREGMGASSPLPATLNNYLSGAQQKADAAPGTPAAVAAVLNAEENLILPTVEGVQTVANLPGYLNDRKARLTALAGMQSLCAALGQNIGEDAPQRVNLSTLDPLSLPAPDKERILNGFEGGKLISYRRLPTGGYEFLARADDANKTLIRGRNGKARIADSDDLEDTGANPVAALASGRG